MNIQKTGIYEWALFMLGLFALGALFPYIEGSVAEQYRDWFWGAALIALFFLFMRPWEKTEGK